VANSMKVKRGDSTDIFEVTVEGVTDYTDYRGEVSVLAPKTNEAVIAKYVIAPTDGKITVALSPAQTALLDVGNYNVVLEVIKEATGVVTFRRELNWPLEVLPSLLNN
jgi:hypothetical protein